jgi:hypothetical protein
MPEGYVLDKPLSFICPECGGVLREERRAGIRQFRCHIGHMLSAETVLVAQFAVFEKKLAGAMAALTSGPSFASVWPMTRATGETARTRSKLPPARPWPAPRS